MIFYKTYWSIAIFQIYFEKMYYEKNKEYCWSLTYKWYIIVACYQVRKKFWKYLLFVSLYPCLHFQSTLPRYLSQEFHWNCSDHWHWRLPRSYPVVISCLPFLFSSQHIINFSLTEQVFYIHTLLKYFSRIVK